MPELDQKELLTALEIANESARRLLDKNALLIQQIGLGQDVKGTPELRRCKRASQELTDELVILRKALP